MRKAIELAAECGLLADTGHLYADEIETFFRRAQAMALRDAADDALKFMSCSCARQLRCMADELEAGK